MLTERPTEEMRQHWIAVWNEYKDRLRPNRKSGQELLAHLMAHYPLEEIDDAQALDVVRLSVLENEWLSEKLVPGAAPEPRAFYVLNQGAGEALYRNREECFQDVERIFVGIDLSTGYYTVEGSVTLWDELCAFLGVDDEDIKNYFLVAEYVASLERFGRLREALGE